MAIKTPSHQWWKIPTCCCQRKQRDPQLVPKPLRLRSTSSPISSTTQLQAHPMQVLLSQMKIPGKKLGTLNITKQSISAQLRAVEATHEKLMSMIGKSHRSGVRFKSPSVPIHRLWAQMKPRHVVKMTTSISLDPRLNMQGRLMLTWTNRSTIHRTLTLCLKMAVRRICSIASRRV